MLLQIIKLSMLSKTAVHGVGSVWATMLWDLTWAYVNKYGFDNNKYTGTVVIIKSCEWY
jgi:hypothetical protein